MRKNSSFYYKDLYLFVIDMKGNIIEFRVYKNSKVNTENII